VFRPDVTRAVALLLAAALANGCAAFLDGDGTSGTSWSGSNVPGFADRCSGPQAPEDCGPRAEQAMQQIARSLGPPYEGPAVLTDAHFVPPDAMIVTYEREPAFEWAAQGDRSGRASAIAIDLTPRMRGEGDAYAILDTEGGGAAGFVVPAEQADALITLLYTRTP
jgi:hypothetical protein